MYGGANKYGGMLAGDRAGAGVSVEDAISGANAEETLMVPYPIGVSEEGTPITQNILLSARLDAAQGGLTWVQEEDEEQSLRKSMAKSQMTSMLHDTQRNAKYDAAITIAIARFREKHGRAPVVLDIGTGTGLLSMMASRAGAKHVYACEMFERMASIAQVVTSANSGPASGLVNIFGEPRCPVTVFACKSTDLTIANQESDVDTALPTRCDMLVTEIFDSALLGEAIQPVLQHAFENLLVDNAVIIPHKATIYAQIIQDASVRQFADTSALAAGMPLPLDTANTKSPTPEKSNEANHESNSGNTQSVPMERSSTNPPWVPLARSGWFEKSSHRSCAGNVYPLPVHSDCIAYEESYKAISAPLAIWEFDFSISNSSSGIVEHLPSSSSTQCRSVHDNDAFGQSSKLAWHTIIVPPTDSGSVDGVLVWWDLYLCSPDTSKEELRTEWTHLPLETLLADNEPYIYSTRPNHIGQIRTAQVSRPDAKSENAIWPWQDHWTQCVFPFVANKHSPFVQSGTDELIRLLCVRSDVHLWFKMEIDNSAHKNTESDQNIDAAQQANNMIPEQDVCVCAAHSLNGSERLSQLNNIPSLGPLSLQFASLFSQNTIENPSRVISCVIDVADASFCALAAAAYVQNYRDCVSNSYEPFIYTAEEMEMSWLLTRNLVQQFTQDRDGSIVSFWTEHFQISRDATECVKDALMHFVDKTNETTHHNVLVCGEPFFFQTANQQMWTAVNLWFKIAALGRTILSAYNQANCQILTPVCTPGIAHVRAVVIQLNNLHQSHGKCGTVSGFDHYALDQAQDGWYVNEFNYPMWQYPFRPMSHVHTLYTLDIANVVIESFNHSSAIPLSAQSKTNLSSKPHAVLVWVDYDTNIRTVHAGTLPLVEIPTPIEVYDVSQLATRGIQSGSPFMSINSSSGSVTGNRTWCRQSLYFLHPSTWENADNESAINYDTINVNVSLDINDVKGLSVKLDV